jgi:hypothetical protein
MDSVCQVAISRTTITSSRPFFAESFRSWLNREVA